MNVCASRKLVKKVNMTEGDDEILIRIGICAQAANEKYGFSPGIPYHIRAINFSGKTSHFIYFIYLLNILLKTTYNTVFSR